jgi:predicted permease
MLDDLRIRLRAFFRPDAVERELDEELQFHIDRQVDKLKAAGFSEDDALRRARLMFGGDGVREACRDERGVNLIDHTVQDLRYAIRVLRASPAFTLVALLSLGLGIGATTAVFTVLDAVVMRPLPVRQPQQLVVVRALLRNERFVLFNPIYEALRSRQHVLTDIAAMSDQPFLPVKLGASQPHIYLRGSFVSGSYFAVLGIEPAIGRGLTAADDTPGASCAAVISHRLWAREFQGSASAVGQVLRVRNSACAIVGVAPEGFDGHQGGYAVDVWLPLRPFHVELLDNHHLAFFSGVIGRMRSDVSRQDAETQLTALYRAIEAAEPPSAREGQTPPAPENFSVRLLSGAQGLGNLRDTFDQSLTIVFGVVLAFLLIAAVNVGNLLLARGAARNTELTTRAALGAGRGRLLRQLATEGVVVSVSGAMLGALLAWTLTPVLTRAITMQDYAVRLDTSARPAVLLGVTAIVVIVTLLVSLLPAWRLSRVDLHPSMAGAGRTTGRSGHGLGRQLIVSQLAVSLLLVTLAGLFVRTVAALHGIDPGFDPNHVVLLEVQREQVSNRSASPADEKRQLATLYGELTGRLGTIPGVSAVGLGWLGLFGGSDLWLTVIRTDAPADRHDARTDYVSDGYFESVGMRIVRGRSFTAADRDGAPRVAVVNETFVRQRFPDSEPLGQSVILEYPRDQQPPFTIVGVVRDSKYNDVREDKAEPMIWAPLRQWPLDIHAITLRTRAGEESAVTRAARSIVTSADQSLMIRRSLTLRDQVDQTVGREQLLLRLASAASVLALFLSAVGLYGMLAYSVASRTRELGLRMALGATQPAVVRMVMREALTLVLVGAACGIPLALGGGYAARAFLFGIAPTDRATLTLACATLVVVALAAAFAPARRASRVAPMTALRHEGSTDAT